MSVHDLEAPKDDGGKLIYPPVNRVGALAGSNRETLRRTSVSLLDLSLAEVRTRANQEIRQQIDAYLGERDEPRPRFSADGWFVAGHQPELFHPGVWLKNFTLHALARAHGANPLNLIVDNDSARHAALRLPARERIETIPFDHWHGEVPFEERDVVDESAFASFPARLRAITESWPFEPILGDFWIDVARAAGRTRNAAERLVHARRGWERRFGLAPVELPVSRLCRTEAFASFAGAVVLEAERFRAAYNTAVAGYRARHGLRSRNHPAPDLTRDGDWIETPFWGWRSEKPERGRLMARRSGAGLELRAGAAAWPTLKADTPADVRRSWLELEPRGFKVRPRALSLTLFTRLCLADVFFHGLGGGKYDEVTDGIMRGFFRLEAPGFMVVTGTLRLPLPMGDVSDDDYRRLAWRSRDLTFNPQRHIAPTTKLSAHEHDLFFTKAVLMQHEPLRHKERKDRFFQMRQINEALQPLVAPERERTREDQGRVVRLLRENEIAARRDYAFCLYPDEKLRRFLQGPLDPV